MRYIISWNRVNTEVRLEDLEKLYPVKGVLEGCPPVWPFRILLPSAHTGLSQLTDKMGTVILKGNYPERGNLNDEFHRTIDRASGNEALLNSIDDLRRKPARFELSSVLPPRLRLRLIRRTEKSSKP